MKLTIVCTLALGVAAVAGAGEALAQDRAAVQPLSPMQAESLLDEETRRQHERRTQAYERLKGSLDMSINASAEARNLAVGSTLQMLTPMTDIKVQQMQQRQMVR